MAVWGSQAAPQAILSKEKKEVDTGAEYYSKCASAALELTLGTTILKTITNVK